MPGPNNKNNKPTATSPVTVTSITVKKRKAQGESESPKKKPKTSKAQPSTATKKTRERQAQDEQEDTSMESEATPVPQQRGRRGRRRKQNDGPEAPWSGGNAPKVSGYTPRITRAKSKAVQQASQPEVNSTDSLLDRVDVDQPMHAPVLTVDPGIDIKTRDEQANKALDNVTLEESMDGQVSHNPLVSTQPHPVLLPMNPNESENRVPKIFEDALVSAQGDHIERDPGIEPKITSVPEAGTNTAEDTSIGGAATITDEAKSQGFDIHFRDSVKWSSNRPIPSYLQQLNRTVSDNQTITPGFVPSSRTSTTTTTLSSKAKPSPKYKAPNTTYALYHRQNIPITTGPDLRDRRGMARYPFRPIKYVQDSWLKTTFEAFEDRQARNPYRAAPRGVDSTGHRLGWWKDTSPTHGGKVGEDNLDEAPVRREHAAAVNGLINAALIPPVGYAGDLKKLQKDGKVQEWSKAANALMDATFEADWKANHEKKEVAGNGDEGEEEAHVAAPATHEGRGMAKGKSGSESVAPTP